MINWQEENEEIWENGPTNNVILDSIKLLRDLGVDGHTQEEFDIVADKIKKYYPFDSADADKAAKADKEDKSQPKAESLKEGNVYKAVELIIEYLDCHEHSKDCNNLNELVKGYNSSESLKNFITNFQPDN